MEKRSGGIPMYRGGPGESSSDAYEAHAAMACRREGNEFNKRGIPVLSPVVPFLRHRYARDFELQNYSYC